MSRNRPVTWTAEFQDAVEENLNEAKKIKLKKKNLEKFCLSGYEKPDPWISAEVMEKITPSQKRKWNPSDKVTFVAQKYRSQRLKTRPEVPKWQHSSLTGFSRAEFIWSFVRIQLKSSLVKLAGVKAKGFSLFYLLYTEAIQTKSTCCWNPLNSAHLASTF